MQSEVEVLFNKIQNLLIKLIPENWKSIYLYASVLKKRRGEMYFYYFPKKLIKTKAVNCYEIPDKFGFEENSYNKNLELLYKLIKDLNRLMIPRWTNVTISIENGIFTIEYCYNNIEESRYSDEERRIVWSVKNLGVSLESLNLKERTLVEIYNETSSIKPKKYSQKIIKTNIEGITSESQEIKNKILKY